MRGRIKEKVDVEAYIDPTGITRRTRVDVIRTSVWLDRAMGDIKEKRRSGGGRVRPSYMETHIDPTKVGITT